MKLVVQVIHRDINVDELVQKFTQLQGDIKVTLDDLNTKVGTLGNAVNSAVGLLGTLKGLVDSLKASQADPAKIQAIGELLDGATSTLVQAVTTNTPTS